MTTKGRGARFVQIRGVVQGVGFRPFVYRLAREHGLAGWVLNDGDGVQIHIEGRADGIDAFLGELSSHPPPAASLDSVVVRPAVARGLAAFEIRGSEKRDRATARISPDLPICERCRTELFDTGDRRAGYPYNNCTECGPRFSIILALPYDRPSTTMAAWCMCEACAREYHDPGDRRFHAQPVACPACGPGYHLRDVERVIASGGAAIEEGAALLRAGSILALKGIGGYHLACDAANGAAVASVRGRKYRKERPFALMARDLEVARGLVELSPEAEALAASPQRPIVLAPARTVLPGIAPGNHDLGVMLPYAPLHHLLFAAGAPAVLVMTSANRSSEPIAYRDDEALERLGAIADVFLVGERPIARRIDDSVVRVGTSGPMILRRARGYAPGAVAHIPSDGPILAVGADLKNAVTLVVNGEAFASQHIGDLDHYDAYAAFQETIRDLTSMYEVDWAELRIVHDLHPQYASTSYALTLPAKRKHAIQHHRAHVASVLAERGAFHRRVLGVAFDGTGYGDDGTIWGGEFFAGSVAEGFRRVAHLRPASLPGGDAAARYPVQAAAGFLAELDGLPDLTAHPFFFPKRYLQARQLLDAGVRTFRTTSAGRLFDTVAAVLGFVREITFEGQAAIWLEQLARSASPAAPYPASFAGGVLDFRPLLAAAIDDRAKERDPAAIARAFHRGLARAIAHAVVALCEQESVDVAALSGGVFQNEILLSDVASCLDTSGIAIWTNREVPPNDGGVSLGQAALGAWLDRPGIDFQAATP